MGELRLFLKVGPNSFLVLFESYSIFHHSVLVILSLHEVVNGYSSILSIVDFQVFKDGAWPSTGEPRGLPSANGGESTTPCLKVINQKSQMIYKFC